MNADLETYVENLLAQKGIPADLDPAVRDQMKQDLCERVEARLNAEMVAALTSEQQDELLALQDRGASEAEIAEYLRGAIPDLQHVMGVALISFQQAYLGT